VLDNVSIIIPPAAGETALENLLGDLKYTNAEIITSSEGARAKSLNAGAAKARHEYLWFLHADSRATAENIDALEQSITTSPDALHYFDLAFDGNGLTTLNAIGANIRSRIFGLPYGDQGLCVSKEIFDNIGEYPEDTPYGEDLLFIRLAKKKGILLKRISSKLTTSARKYRDHGWLKLSLYRQLQLLKLLRIEL